MKAVHLIVLMVAAHQTSCWLLDDIAKGIGTASKDVIQAGAGLITGGLNVVGQVGKEVIDVGTGIIGGGINAVEHLGQGAIDLGLGIVGGGLGLLGLGVDIFGNVAKLAIDFSGKVIGSAVDAGVNVMCAVLGKLVQCNQAGFGGIAPLPFQCRGKADIIFLVDASASVGKIDFTKQLSFAANMAGSFLINDANAKFGLVEFSTGVTKWFDLKTYNDVGSVLKAIVSTPYSNGLTNTDKALDSVLINKMFDPVNGGRANAPDIVVLLTDGQSNNPQATLAAANRLKAAGIKVISVGIGLSVNVQELVSTSSLPELVFRSDSFDELHNSLYSVTQRTCAAAGGNEQNVIVEPPIPEEPKACDVVADIIDVIDSSGSIGPLNFQQKVLPFVVDIANAFTIGKTDVLVGGVVFSGKVQKRFDLKDNPNIQSLRRAILSIPFLNSTTRTDLALELILSENMFSKTAGGRTAATKFVLLVTDGASDNKAKTLAAANKLKSKGYVIVAIGVGNANPTELQAVASTNGDVFIAKTFDSLKSIKDAVVDRACEAAKKK